MVTISLPPLPVELPALPAELPALSAELPVEFPALPAWLCEYFALPNLRWQETVGNSGWKGGGGSVFTSWYSNGSIHRLRCYTTGQQKKPIGEVENFETNLGFLMLCIGRYNNIKRTDTQD